MTERIRIDIDGGKYTYVADDKGSCAYRHGEPWRDLPGDNFVGAMAHEIEKLRARIAEAEKTIEDYKDGTGR